MKKIVLISTFCDTDEKIKILLENIKILKGKKLDIMCLSPNFIQLPNEIIELSDFTFYTKENPILDYSTGRTFYHWWDIIVDNKTVKMSHFCDDYGWAALYQTKKLADIALTFDYDIFYNTIYDIILNDELLEDIDNDEVNLIHPKRDHNDPEVLWDSSLHFMVFDRELMEKVRDEITIEEYLKPSDNQIAEGEVLKWKNKFNIPTKGCIVDDKIFIHSSDNDFFNYLDYNNFKFFVNKDKGNIKMLFHHIEIDREINVEINNTHYEYFLKAGINQLVTLDINCNDIYSFNIKVDGDNINYMKNYNKLQIATIN